MNKYISNIVGTIIGIGWGFVFSGLLYNHSVQPALPLFIIGIFICLISKNN